AALDPLQEAGPPLDLPVVEAIGTAEVTESLAPPVDLPHLDDAVNQFIGQAPTLLRIGVIGRRPPAERHRRPAVDEAHDVEGPAQHAGVLAHGHGRGVGYVRPGGRPDDPPLAQDALVARGGGGARRDAQRTVDLAPPDLEDLVLAPTG